MKVVVCTFTMTMSRVKFSTTLVLNAPKMLKSQKSSGKVKKYGASHAWSPVRLAGACCGAQGKYVPALRQHAAAAVAHHTLGSH